MLLTTKVFHVFNVPNDSSVNTVKGREAGRKYDHILCGPLEDEGTCYNATWFTSALEVNST